MKYVTPEDPVRTSTDALPVNERVSPLFRTTPAAPIVESSWPSSQTLIQAGPPCTLTTTRTPL